MKIESIELSNIKSYDDMGLRYLIISGCPARAISCGMVSRLVVFG